MSEVRLVRCPKCDKVLPEPSGCPVYRCGGCGAILRAKKKPPVSDGMLKEPGENSSTDIIDKEPLVKEDTVIMSGKSPLRSRVGSGDGSKLPLDAGALTEFQDGLPKSPMKDRSMDDDVKTPGESRDASQSPMRERGRSRNVSKSPMRGRGGTPVSMRTRDAGRSPMREGTSLSDLDGVKRSPTRDGDVPKSSLREGPGADFKGNSGEAMVGKIALTDSFKSWLPDGKHDGQSGDNYPSGRRSTWRDHAVVRPDQNSEGIKSVIPDELGLTSEGSLDNSAHEIGSGKGRMSQDGRFNSGSAGRYARPNVINRPSNYHSDPINGIGDPRQSFESASAPVRVQDLHLVRVKLLRKYKELKDQLSGLDDAEMSTPGFYSESDGRSVEQSSRIRHGPNLDRNRKDVNNLNHPMNADQYVDQMKMGPCFKHPPTYRVPEYLPGRSVDFGQDPRDSRVNKTHAHHPACGCTLCYYSNDRQGQDRRSSLALRRKGNRSMDLKGYGPRSYDPRMAHTGPQRRFSHHTYHHCKVEVATLNKRLCHPISGGSPFVICNSCFQLLKLPGSFRPKLKNQQLQCGACSTIILVDLHRKSFGPPSPIKIPDSVHVACVPHEVANESRPKHHLDSLAATSTNNGSYDYNGKGSNLHSMCSEASRVTKGNKLLSSSAENISGFASSPSRFSVDEHLSDNSSVRSNQLRSPEKQIIDKDISQEGSLDTTGATETELPINELPTTGRSEDSEHIPTESPEPRNDEVIQSNADDLSKGFSSSSDHGSPGIAEVYVNLQAISQHMVKKAEKFAGPIQPGEYWYDPVAGFWGVMGHQCLGIIPPFIEEFSYPMPENCSRGNSNVFVNGRELQESDLQLLVRRGLPTTKDKHYIVDISGRVVDEQTRDFVVNLGRLARSVEKNKCGFGMQVPEQLDD